MLSHVIVNHLNNKSLNNFHGEVNTRYIVSIHLYITENIEYKMRLYFIIALKVWITCLGDVWSEALWSWLWSRLEKCYRIYCHNIYVCELSWGMLFQILGYISLCVYNCCNWFGKRVLIRCIWAVDLLHSGSPKQSILQHIVIIVVIIETGNPCWFK
jgi:hypothetical protein